VVITLEWTHSVDGATSLTVVLQPNWWQESSTAL